MSNRDLEERREMREQMFSQMEQKLKEIYPKEEYRLYTSEDRIVLSHAMFWVMTQPQFLKGKIRKEKIFLLIRQYQEEMLDAFLMEDDYFSELLDYCIIYETLPIILNGMHDYRTEKDARKLAAISIVAAGYGGDMPEDLCNELLDDIDFHNNKVKCRKIEQMLPKLNKMVEKEIEASGF